jgi:hypothetical protein
MVFHAETKNEQPEICTVLVYEGGNLLPYGTGISQFTLSNFSSPNVVTNNEDGTI